jgi:hypothetical protein
MKITQKQLEIDCAVIAQLTNENHHTDALIRLAQMLGDDKCAKILGHLREIHHLQGHLAAPLAEMRREIGASLLITAEREFLPEQFDKIYGAF